MMHQCKRNVTERSSITGILLRVFTIHMYLANWGLNKMAAGLQQTFWNTSSLKEMFALLFKFLLTHWGRVTHICVGNLTIIGPDNGLSPDRRQAIIWTNAGVLLIGPWGTNFSEISIDFHTFSFKKINLKMSSAKWRPFCLGLNVLKCHFEVQSISQYWFRYWLGTKQETSHYLNQYWPRCFMPHGVTRLKWIDFCCALTLKINCL